MRACIALTILEVDQADLRDQPASAATVSGITNFQTDDLIMYNWFNYVGYYCTLKSKSHVFSSQQKKNLL